MDNASEDYDTQSSMSAHDRLGGGVQRTVRVNNAQQTGQFALMRAFKWGILGVAVILAVITFSWGMLEEDDFVEQPTLKEEVVAAVQKNELIQPRFDSVDAKGQPFTITADQAQRPEKGRVTLAQPAGDIQLVDGRWISARAQEGEYFEVEKKLNLMRAVEIYDNQGYMLKTQRLDVDMNGRVMRSDHQVEAQGPAGQIKAQAFHADLEAGLLHFSGPAELKLFLSDEGGLGQLK